MKEKACGCIIIKNGKVLLIKQITGHWGFPKGHMEEGETEEETAIREVKEETNLDVEIDKNKKYTVEYTTDKGKDKIVTLFLAKEISGELKPQECEISKLEWLEFDKALETLTYENTKEVLKKVISELN